MGYTSGLQTPYSRSSYSFTSADSFLSAQGEVNLITIILYLIEFIFVFLLLICWIKIADLEDFADIPIDDSLPSLYQGSMKQLDESGIPCRVLRTELVGCETDIEYLCKLHCIRLACQGVFHLPGAEQWFISAGRSVLADLLTLAEKDPRDVLDAYDAMMVFVQDQSQRFKLAAEMEHRGVKAVTFYDVVLDFILMDAFEDLTAPPSSVLAVINNRWLSNGFKEGVRIRFPFNFLPLFSPYFFRQNDIEFDDCVGLGDSRLECTQSQTTETTLPGRLHLTFLRNHGTSKPRFGLGLPWPGFRPEKIVFHLQSNFSCFVCFLPSFQMVDHFIELFIESCRNKWRDIYRIFSTLNVFVTSPSKRWPRTFGR